MTVLEFIRKLVEISRTHERQVIAIDFEPSPDGLALRFHFRP
jgi:hypothetical protein